MITTTARPESRRTIKQARLLRFIQGLSLWVTILLFFVMQSVAARASEEPGAGELRLETANGNTETASLLTTDYRVQISGMIADTRLRQSFENTSDDWREGTYVFPLPAEATVYDMTLHIGDRIITGKIKTREKARKTYEKAREQDKQAAQVEQQRPNRFTTRVANIPPGEKVSVELRYQRTVNYHDGEFELRLPTTLTPRYMPGEPQVDPQKPVKWQRGWATPTTEVPDAGAISPYTVRPADVGPDSHRATVELSINAGLPIADISSPTHSIHTERQTGTITVTPQSNAIVMDRDLVVRWSPKRGQAPKAAVFHEHHDDKDYLLTLLVPGISGTSTLPRELTFVVDTSGSMAGESIRQARQALLAALNTLKPDDRFNIIQFNSHTSALFQNPRNADRQALNEARNYARHLQANGGTDIAPALDLALRKSDQPDDETGHRVRQVVFVTDGAVGNESALFQQIENQLGSARLFTVGIGSAPNMHFMREAARYGRGSFTSVNDTAEVGRQLGSLLDRMAAPVLGNVRVDWPQTIKTGQVFPARPSDLFKGEPLMLVSRGITPEGSVTVSGTLPDGTDWQQSLALDSAAPGRGLHRYWARQKIDAISDQSLHGVSDDTIREQVTPLALKHGLVTPYTSFVAVAKEPARPQNAPLKQDDVPTLLPSGSQPGMLRYPQTATASPLLIALGLAGLLPGLLLLAIRRRTKP